MLQKILKMYSQNLINWNSNKALYCMELFEIIENVSGVLSVDINEEVSIDPTGVNADKCRAK